MTDKEINAAALKRAYRLSFRKGKRAFAALIDAFAFGAIILLTLYILIRPRFQNRTAAIVMTVTAGLGILLVCLAVDRTLFERHVKKLRKQVKAEIVENKMRLDPDAVWDRIGESGSVFISKSLEGITADEVMKAIRTKTHPVTIVSLAGPTEKAARLLEASSGKAKAASPSNMGVDPKKLYNVRENEIDARIIEKHLKTLKKPPQLKELLRIPEKGAFKYLAVGGALMLMSFFVRCPLYYRAAASVSLGIGAYAAVFGSLVKRRKRPDDGVGTL